MYNKPLLIDVTQERYVALLSEQKTRRKLEYDANKIYEPTLNTWNDFSLGNWPESIVFAQQGKRFKVNEDALK